MASATCIMADVVLGGSLACCGIGIGKPGVTAMAARHCLYMCCTSSQLMKPHNLVSDKTLNVCAAINRQCDLAVNTPLSLLQVEAVMIMDRRQRQWREEGMTAEAENESGSNSRGRHLGCREA